MTAPKDNASDLGPKPGETSANPHETVPHIQPTGLHEGAGCTESRSWADRVRDAALMQPANHMTLHRLRALEYEIRRDGAQRAGGETIEHVEAIALLCAYKLQIMRLMESFRDEARERAYREGRARYVW